MRFATACASVVVTGITLVASVGAGSAAVPSATAGPPRAIGPSVGDTAGLYAVDALARDDVWAVGRAGGKVGPLIEHWDGSSWSKVPAPRVPHGSLVSVSADAGDDVWAVGHLPNSTKYWRPLAEHWDGSSWRVAKLMPSAPARQTWISLSDVAAVSPSDAWAVGMRYWRVGGGFGYRSVMFHWDGDTWSRVNDLSARRNSGLSAVTALGPDDVWVVGWTSLTTFVEHWDGRHWSVVQTPTPPTRHDFGFSDVAVGGTDDVWLSGTDINGQATTLIEHWDGDRWTRMKTFSNHRRSSRLAAIDEIDPDDVWSTGTIGPATGRPGRELAEHWDGGRWRLSRTTKAGPGPQALLGVSGVASDDVWAVGYAVILHWDGTTWTRVTH